jgi:hypothetical protein
MSSQSFHISSSLPELQIHPTNRSAEYVLIRRYEDQARELVH